MPALSQVTWKDKFKGKYCDVTLAEHKVYFLKPQTYMNLSGESVQPLCQFYKILPEEILVLHDELDLPLGEIQFKKGGGLAGHNGLKSMAQHLATQDFYRLRIGIGRPPHGSVSNWVLSRFSDEQDLEVELVLKYSIDAILEFLKLGMKVATKYNKKNILDKK
jgi:PTH1 family peptidyl-tRNA hydrolase